MKLLVACLLGFFITHSLAAQDATNLWLRYALRAPVSEHWTWHNEPDFRMELSPVSAGFRQFLLRSDMQRRFNAVHTLGFGLVGLFTNAPNEVEISELRPQLTWFVRPASLRNLQLRARLEWRQKNTELRSVDSQLVDATLRCRGMVQYELPLERNTEGMRKGFRTQAELLMRAYSSSTLDPFDQLRLSAAYVTPLSATIELEGAYLWFFREQGITQQWFRLSAVHHLQSRPRGNTQP